MSTNLTNPTFMSFVDNVNLSIINHINFKNYFSMTAENKINVQHVTMKLIKNSIKLRAKISDTELRSFVTVLWKKNEELEIFEFAQILYDVLKNFDTINESTKPVKRQQKIIKTDKKINED